jgi:hypothetical protein
MAHPGRRLPRCLRNQRHPTDRPRSSHRTSQQCLQKALSRRPTSASLPRCAVGDGDPGPKLTFPGIADQRRSNRDKRGQPVRSIVMLKWRCLSLTRTPQSGSEQRKEVDQHDSDDDFLNHWYHNLVPLLGGLLWRCPRAKPANDCFR